MNWRNSVSAATTAAILPALGSGSALAAELETGIVDSGPATLLIGLAAAIVGALLLRHKATSVTRRIAEKLGRHRLAAALAKARVDSLHNVILPGCHDGLSRIDCAVLTSAGIVCIRVRHGGGMVFGNASDPQWTCVHGVLRRSFLNPLLQNEGRVRAVEAVVADMPVVSLVVFTGNVRFSLRPAANALKVHELAAWLDAYQDDNPSAADPESAWLCLQAAALTDPAAQRDFEAQLSFG